MPKDKDKTKKRRKRPSSTPENFDWFKPVVTADKLGGEEDPCFGKLYSLVHKACGSCGDSELCAIVYSHQLHKARAEQEEKVEFKDLAEGAYKAEGDKKIRALAKKLLIAGKSSKVIKARLLTKYGVVEADAIKIINKLKAKM
jgi:hypothetical protein